jgi:hypothetical protein
MLMHEVMDFIPLHNIPFSILVLPYFLYLPPCFLIKLLIFFIVDEI